MTIIYNIKLNLEYNYILLPTPIQYYFVHNNVEGRDSGDETEEHS